MKSVNDQTTNASSNNEELKLTTAVTKDEDPPVNQLTKLKSFLKTIYQFSKDLSSVQRDQVKELILSVIKQQISEQAFYTELQGSTKFPLRPYVVPFLESSLPLLRHELASASKENIESTLFGDLKSDFNGNATTTAATPNNIDCHRSLSSKDLSPRKRRFILSSRESQISPKRLHMSQTSPSSSAYPQLTATSAITNGNSTKMANNIFSGISNIQERRMSPLGPSSKTSDSLRSPSSMFARPDLISNRSTDWWSLHNDEWKNIESLFTTMVTTMERLRYAMLMFQQRSKLTQMWTEKCQLHQQHQQDSSQKIEEVRRKADATVQEVKLAALTELQKAVLSAEQKALQMIAVERAQMEKLLRDTQIQESSIDNCWNCGRKAGQTCSGCGLARYCGVFCQHKDWSKHRSTCGQQSSSSSSSVVDKALNIKREPSSIFMQNERSSPKSV